MTHELYNAQRQAENDLAEVNRHLADDKKRANPQIHSMLIDARDKTMRTLETLDRMNNRQPYSDTNIGYRSNNRSNRSDNTANDVADMVHTAMDAVDRIIPHLDDRYADDDNDVDDRRGRPRTTRRGVGRWTQVRRHVRRMPRRSEMDDRYDDNRYDMMDDDYNMDNRYDDYNYNDIDDRRGVPGTGRYSRRRRRSEAEMDDMRYDDRYNRSNDRYDTRSINNNRSDRSNRSSDTNPVDDRYNDNRSDNRYDDRSDDNRSIGPRG